MSHPVATNAAFNLHVDAAGAYYLEGPAEYMNAQGIELMHAILDQGDALLDQLLLKYRQEDWQQAVLRRFQLDYVAWLGVEQMNLNSGSSQPRQPALLNLSRSIDHA